MGEHEIKPPATALAKAEPMAIQPLARQSIETTVGSLNQVRKFITKALNTGYQRELKRIGKRQPTEAEQKKLKTLEIDYGAIPGVNRKFLLQPGAEKLCMWLHVRPVYDTSVEKVPDHPGHIDVVSRCRLFSVATGEEVFSGPMASCTSMESNYRYRWIKMEPVPTYEWAMKEGRIGRELGTHRSFKKDDKWVWMERREHPNIFDELNKVRQMAEKRAIVKACRNFGALSEIFTEDPSEWVLDDLTNAPAEDEAPAVPGSVVKAPEPDSKIDKTVEIRWPSDTAEVAMIHLPDLPGAADLASKIMDFADYRPELRAWQCPAVYVADVAKLATELGLQVVEIEQAPATPKPQAPPPPAEPAIEGPVSGKVTSVNKMPGTKKGAPYYALGFGGRTVYCYRTTLFAHLALAKDQECTFVILPGSYPKITAIKRIGATEFEEDAPVVQRNNQ